MSRRLLMGSALCALVGACATPSDPLVVTETLPPPPLGTPEEVDWRPWFKDLSKGAILVRLDARRLTYWSADGAAYREFPIGTPELAEYVKVGRTSVVRRRASPDWRPTPEMLARHPDLPRHVAPGPDNPLGSHALYLGWPTYAIHGTNDDGSVGRATTSGCIRLFNEHVAWLYEHVPVGTPVEIVHENDGLAPGLSQL